DSSSSASDARLRSQDALNSIWDADSKEAPPPGIWDGDHESDTARKCDHRCPVVDAGSARRPYAGSLSDDAGTFKNKWRRLPDGPLESFMEPEAAVSRGCWRGRGLRLLSAAPSFVVMLWSLKLPPRKKTGWTCRFAVRC
ncbi:unnamed protein product, partial [Symbiodinium necroappetens]